MKFIQVVAAKTKIINALGENKSTLTTISLSEYARLVSSSVYACKSLEFGFIRSKVGKCLKKPWDNFLSFHKLI